ncbi:hypothetical protein [Streptomyces sp. NPDC002559]
MPEPAGADPEPATAPAGPPRARETASDGYRRVLAAHQETARPSRVDPSIAEAVERQTAAMRELSRRAFPETDVVLDDARASIEQARIERRRQAAVSHSAALRRARAERAARQGQTPDAAIGDGAHAARLGRTA